MDSCPIVAVTNDHKLSGLKYIFVLSQFWRSEVQNGSHLAKIKVPGGCIPSGGSRGGSVFLPFPEFSDCLYSWLVTSFFIFRGHQVSVPHYTCLPLGLLT